MFFMEFQYEYYLHFNISTKSDHENSMHLLRVAIKWTEFENNIHYIDSIFENRTSFFFCSFRKQTKPNNRYHL